MFKQALASAADVSIADVMIEKIEMSQSNRRNLLEERIRVEISIKVPDGHAAHDPASIFKIEELNSELMSMGLPAATLVESAATNSGRVSSLLSTPLPVRTTPPPITAPIILPLASLHTGYVEVSISTPRDWILNVTRDEIPMCTELSATDAEDKSHDRLVITHTCTVTAISCREGVSSNISSRRFEIHPGPVVEVKLNLVGSISLADISPPTKGALLKAFAALIRIPVELVSIVSVKDMRRGLLSVQITIEVITNSIESADRIRRTIAAADFRDLALDELGWQDVEITLTGAPTGGAYTQSTQMSTPAPLKTGQEMVSDKEQRLDSPLVIGALLGSAVVLGIGLAGSFVVRRRRREKREETQPKCNAAKETVADQSSSQRFEDSDEEEVPSSHESDDSNRVDVEFSGSSDFMERHRRASKKDLEHLLQNPEGTRLRLQEFLKMMKTGQSEGTDKYLNDLSSSDEENKGRRVDAALQGTARRAGKSRSRAEVKALESLLMDPEGVQKRRDHLLALMRHDRQQRKEQGDAVSSSDEEKQSSKVDAQVMGEIMGIAHQSLTAKRRSRTEKSDLELLFMDVEGVKKRREELLEMMKEDRSKRRACGEVASSDDDERDMRKIDAQIEGLYTGQAAFVRRLTR